MGTYEYPKALNFVKRRNPNYSFGAPRDGQTVQNKTTFTTEYAKAKKFVPGVGCYKTENCFEKIHIPYMRKRY